MWYMIVGYRMAGLTGTISFISAYIYCVATYGFLWGLGLGWLPSFILANIVGLITIVGWGPIALLIAYTIVTGTIPVQTW